MKPEPHPNPSTTDVHLDRIAALFSVTCALHCLIWPLAFSILPGLSAGLRSFQHPWHDWAILMLKIGALEPWFIAAAVLIAVASTGRGWRHHGQWGPLLLAAVGSVGLLGGSLAAKDAMLHFMFAASGGLLLAMAHWRNLHLYHGSTGAP